TGLLILQGQSARMLRASKDGYSCSTGVDSSTSFCCWAASGSRTKGAGKRVCSLCVRRKTPLLTQDQGRGGHTMGTSPTSKDSCSWDPPRYSLDSSGCG
ncbi:unnamed protein product, partial [Ixodes persulcatus]